MRTPLVRLALLSALALGVTACGTRPVCTPQVCPTGCCNANDQCVSGTEQAACGTGGNTCASCTAGAQACAAQACVAVTVDAGAGDAGTGDGGVEFCMRSPVECSDQVIQGLDLKTGVAPGLIQNAADGTGFLSTIDSRGGGFPPTQSYIYARFTDTGLDKLPLDDMQALDSMDWDIAFRRFVIRINSGDSGPACVAGATLPNSTTYASVTSVPTGIGYEEDDFVDRPPTCAWTPDGSGLDSSPRTYLSSYYDYTSCVSMTGRTFIVKPGNGRRLKLTVTTYYATEAGQASCDSSGSSGGALGGTIRLRWAFLE